VPFDFGEADLTASLRLAHRELAAAEGLRLEPSQSPEPKMVRVSRNCRSWGELSCLISVQLQSINASSLDGSNHGEEQASNNPVKRRRSSLAAAGLSPIGRHNFPGRRSRRSRRILPSPMPYAKHPLPLSLFLLPLTLPAQRLMRSSAK